jgi:hypothetical protein
MMQRKKQGSSSQEATPPRTSHRSGRISSSSANSSLMDGADAFVAGRLMGKTFETGAEDLGRLLGFETSLEYLMAALRGRERM